LQMALWVSVLFRLGLRAPAWVRFRLEPGAEPGRQLLRCVQSIPTRYVKLTA